MKIPQNRQLVLFLCVFVGIDQKVDTAALSLFFEFSAGLTKNRKMRKNVAKFVCRGFFNAQLTVRSSL